MNGRDLLLGRHHQSETEPTAVADDYWPVHRFRKADFQVMERRCLESPVSEIRSRPATAENLSAFRETGFAANRRLLRLEYLSHDCLIGDDHLDALAQPIVVDTQRVAALRLGARLAVLYVRISARGFRPAASLPTSGTIRHTP